MASVYRILIDDPSGRFRAGDLGEECQNDFVKYDYKIRLQRPPCLVEVERPVLVAPVFYFMANEVEQVS